MNTVVKNTTAEEKIFTSSAAEFTSLALQTFRYQHQHNAVYRSYCDVLKIDSSRIQTLTDIPFLPISFFKTHSVQVGNFVPEAIFESSGTTQTIPSRHTVKSLALYQRSFTEGFKHYYGNPADYCILALLPSYLERQHSSLVLMADALIKQSGHTHSGFYLNEWQQLKQVITLLEQQQQKTLLIGVTFALLDFAALEAMPLQHTIVMETGGMKGRREEMTRQQVHEELIKAFQLPHIHSEYGMTELLSQAYSLGNGIFKPVPWMKVLIREEDDPFAIYQPGTQPVSNGAINIIDLANLYSCSFIATEDAGRLYADGSFEVLGRLDNTDIRGCSLMAI
ncbi:MAG: hypothetical protein RL172_2309 [Bacteroidota bacterium]